MSIEYLVLGFEPTIFIRWVSVHNHETRTISLDETKVLAGTMSAETGIEIFERVGQYGGQHTRLLLRQSEFYSH